MAHVRDRARFVYSAVRAGYVWFAGIWRFLAPLVGLLAALGLIAAARAYVSWIVVAFAGAGLLLLLFAEGAYRLWREAAPQPLHDALATLVELHREGQDLKRRLTDEFVSDRLEAPGGLIELEHWTSKVISAVTAVRPGDAFEIEHEDGARIITAVVGTNPGETQILNCLSERLRLLQGVIADLKR